MTSISSEMSLLAESMVSDVSVEDGCRVANPSDEEIEKLKGLLESSIHEVHHMGARKIAKERQA